MATGTLKTSGHLFDLSQVGRSSVHGRKRRGQRQIDLIRSRTSAVFDVLPSLRPLDTTITRFRFEDFSILIPLRNSTSCSTPHHVKFRIFNVIRCHQLVTSHLMTPKLLIFIYFSPLSSVSSATT
ncbi:hypothetical protein ACFQ4E_17340 [Litorisediminicola beolgyonensis]|uniref:Uncharacterized protein n=1 Tax=Litorisediminicola beolgyonensis TaxID=1173614 RepID=A0ABW3ZMB5_9RHOB